MDTIVSKDVMDNDNILYLIAATPVIGLYLITFLMFLFRRQQTVGGTPVLAGNYVDGTIYLVWTPVPGTAIYTIELDGVDVATVVGTSSDFMLSEGTYVFRVRADMGSYSNAVTIIARQIVLTITYTGIDTTYDLTWTDTSLVGDTYEIYMKTGPGLQPWVFLDSVSFGTNTYQVNLPYLVLKTFRVDRVAPYAISNAVSVTHQPTTPPDQPGLFATPNMLDPNTAVDVSWTPGSGVTSSWELQASPDGMMWSPLQTFASNVYTYTHVGLTQNTQYFYQIRGINMIGSSVWTQADTTTANGIPRTPILLSVTQALTFLPNAAVQVEWLDEAGDEDAYLLYRQDVNLPDPPQLVGTFAPTPGSGNTVSELDTYRLYNGTFQYFVIAQNMMNGNSFQSNSLEVTIDGTKPTLGPVIAQPAPGIAQNAITASWPYVYGADVIRVSIKDVLTNTTVFGPVDIAPTSTVYTFFSLTPATEYQIIISADNTFGSTVDDFAFMWTVPPSTDGLLVESIANSAAAILFWTDKSGSQEVVVDVYKRPQFGTFTLLTGVVPNNNQFGPDLVQWVIDRDTLSSQTYEYKVVYEYSPPFPPDETNTVTFTAPVLTTVAPTYIQAFNSRRFNQLIPSSFPVNMDTVSYYLASFFNVAPITINGVSFMANISVSGNKAGFFFTQIVEFCTKPTPSGPWTPVATLATIGPLILPSTNVVDRVVIATTPVTLSPGGTGSGFQIHIPLITPVVVPSSTQFCIRVKVKSYENLSLGPSFSSQSTDTTTQIRTFNIDPVNGYTGSSRNLGPFLASTGGEVGLIENTLTPVVPLTQNNSEVPHIFMTLSSP